MYIWGYFFQKGYFKGSSKKKVHQQNTLGELTSPLLPLFRRAWNYKTLYKRTTKNTNQMMH